jgi:DNA-3-methyladenine glycosylase
MKKILTAKFFNRPTLIVAEELLGKYLVRKIGKREVAVQITETEAYDGLKDKASHASRGQTLRNAPMFGSAGNFYVYFTYGMHWMLNIVTGPKNYPAAILIRGTKQVSGPARLTKFLGIDKSLNGKPATKKSGIWFEDRGDLIRQKDTKRAPRIGVNYAGPMWSKKKYRFLIEKTR